MATLGRDTVFEKPGAGRPGATEFTRKYATLQRLRQRVYAPTPHILYNRMHKQSAQRALETDVSQRNTYTKYK